MQSNNTVKIFTIFEPRDYKKLGLNKNPFPAIALCNYNLNTDFFMESMFHEMKELYEILKKQSSERRKCNVFLRSQSGTGKTTFLINFCRWINMSRGNVYAIYTSYPSSWGIYKLYQYSFHWIGRKDFTDAYNYSKELMAHNRISFIDSYLIEKTRGLSLDPYAAYDKLKRTNAADKMSAILSSVINMVAVYRKIDVIIICIDNIENVWDYIGPYQRLIFLSFVKNTISKIIKPCITIMPLPYNPNFESWMRYNFPEAFEWLSFTEDHVFNLNLQEENYCIKIVEKYLKLCRDFEGTDRLFPFTETAVRNIILNNTGVISNILSDAFNLIEIGVKSGMIIDDKVVAEYYKQYKPSKFSVQELSLKCPATNYKFGHSWVNRGYDYEKKLWRRTCSLCGITEESTPTGYRRFFDANGKLISETRSNRK